MKINIFNKNVETVDKNYFGINITNSGYCIARITPAIDTKPVLDICVYEPWEKGAPDDKQVKNTLKEIELSGNNCSTILDHDDYVLLNVEAPEGPEEDAISAVRWGISEMIDFDVSSAVIDVFESPLVGGEDMKKNIYVVAAPLDKVQQKANFLQNAQANLSVIDIPEMVLRNLVSILPENKDGVAILYMMERHGMILLVRDSYVYLARRLEVGSADLRAVAKQLATLETEPSQSTVIQESNPLLDEALVLEVLRSIDYYDRYFSLTPLSGLVITPMESELPGFQETLAKLLGINVRYLDLNDLLDCKTPMSKAMQEHSFLAIGAALRSYMEQNQTEDEQDLNQEQHLEEEEVT